MKLKIFAGDWLDITAKLVIAFSVVWLIVLFAKACSPETDARRVKLGGSVELGDSTWPE